VGGWASAPVFRGLAMLRSGIFKRRLKFRVQEMY